MYFGLDRATDEESLAEFIKRFSDDCLMRELIPRMTETEIHQVVDLLTAIMRQHLSGKEYHTLFLGEDHHHD